ncbi:MAG: hypothetical protein IJ187_05165 [Neisseriaceae bacterium]|nr:hypothetical protein [Neisseriaceae bacterium]
MTVSFFGVSVLFFRLPEKLFALPLYLIGYPETVFKLRLRSFKNCFRRLPRRAFGTARNDDKGCLKLFCFNLPNRQGGCHECYAFSQRHRRKR